MQSLQAMTEWLVGMMLHCNSGQLFHRLCRDQGQAGCLPWTCNTHVFIQNVLCMRAAQLKTDLFQKTAFPATMHPLLSQALLLRAPSAAGQAPCFTGTRTHAHMQAVALWIITAQLAGVRGDA